MLIKRTVPLVLPLILGNQNAGYKKSWWLGITSLKYLPFTLTASGVAGGIYIQNDETRINSEGEEEEAGEEWLSVVLRLPNISCN